MAIMTPKTRHRLRLATPEGNTNTISVSYRKFAKFQKEIHLALDDPNPQVPSSSVSIPTTGSDGSDQPVLSNRPNRQPETLSHGSGPARHERLTAMQNALHPARWEQSVPTHDSHSTSPNSARDGNLAQRPHRSTSITFDETNLRSTTRQERTMTDQDARRGFQYHPFRNRRATTVLVSASPPPSYPPSPSFGDNGDTPSPPPPYAEQDPSPRPNCTSSDPPADATTGGA
ncbi:hypothetical protein QBC44DRAFT_364747 [Cladorrhinum sp. PSN332]|nr:hypothetical protein QBC44DRAFT_364747 [Cladorrhinum sp. PSN332]